MNTTRKISFKAFEEVWRFPVDNYIRSFLFLPASFGRLIKLIVVVSMACFSYQQIFSQETIEVVKMKEQPIVVGKLNGKNAYFLVDTGASFSILNEKDSKKYKIKHSKSISGVKFISGLVSRHKGEIFVAVNANLYLGNRKMEVCFKVLDLSNIKASIGRSTGIWINGIIGSDMMKRYNFIIDYDQQKIYFTHFTFKRSTCL